ncbi:aminotransferase class I/II-fold pyridoxal phosphate-dependent enzyme [Amycolatopsis sp. CA-230715]|uniref:aminotransferase class I/II-fold pyridoxal phosphate-dependent enzyme n=1 Tax=Amycolatopsis sp. CA-230715 TaxID=2745196 RepID=UPI001C01F90A|nr:aminotransferase class I/II-fold pyridoxal phosphate-dependent enzyme [Amycolatopsis sp. CA-230715]
MQSVSPAGLIDLGPGYLEPALLPVSLLNEAYTAALGEFGAAALSYGADPGVAVLRECVAARVSEVDGVPWEAGEILVTAGTSQALHLLANAVADRGDVVFVDRTSYDFGRRILADEGLRVREVAGDEFGMSPVALAESIAGAKGERIGFVCLNPTFHNPTGTVVGEARRRALLEVADRYGVLVVEDDAYAELSIDGGGVPCSMAGLAGGRGVIRLGTFSKTLAPGLRLGWLQADRRTVDRLSGRGLFVSGGGVNHLASLAVAVLVRDGHYDRHLRLLRDALRVRRDALVTGLRAGLGAEVAIRRPGGGFFLWLRFRGGRTEDDLRSAAAEAGVSVAAGSRFGTVREPSIRLAYSFTPPERLTAAAAALASAWRCPVSSSKGA